MARIIIVFILICLFSVSNAQVITESLIELREVYNPLFGNEKSVLLLDFVRTFQHGDSDTVYSVIFQVNNETSNVESVTLGTSLFSIGGIGGGGSGVSATISYNEDEGSARLGYDSFMKFYDAANSVFTYIQYAYQSKSDLKNIVASYDFDKFTFAGEYITKPLTRTAYFLSFGDAKFTMSKEKYVDFVKTCRNIKESWNKRVKMP